MTRQSTEDSSTPEWRQLRAIAPSRQTLFLRLVVDGPAGRAWVSLTQYSGSEMESLEHLETAEASFDDIFSVSATMLMNQLREVLLDISPF